MVDVLKPVLKITALLRYNAHISVLGFSREIERLHFHFSLSCIGEGNGNPLQCSCLENPRDGGGWWAAIYGVVQSGTRLKRLSSSSREIESIGCVCVCVCVLVCVCVCVQLLSHVLSLCDPMNCSPPGYSIYWTFQARILEWVAIFCSRGSSQPRDQTHVSCISCIGRQFFTTSATWRAPGYICINK